MAAINITTNTDTKIYDGDGTEKTIVLKGNFGGGQAIFRTTDDSFSTYEDVFMNEPHINQAQNRSFNVKLNTGVSLYLSTRNTTNAALVVNVYA